MTPREPSAILLAHVAATFRRHAREMPDCLEHVPDRTMVAPVWYARCVTCDAPMRGPF
jgi:hypothetical protein